MPAIDEEVLVRLRNELRNKLDGLKDSLGRDLSENEVYLAMFPLVLLCDEMVMSSLPKQQQTLWFLLQSELFQINYGGDVFYGVRRRRLAKPDTPILVFEVLFYCLSAGFVGKFGPMAARCSAGGCSASASQEPTSDPQAPAACEATDKSGGEARGDPAVAAKRRPTVPSAPPSRRRGAIWYYAVTLGMLVLIVFPSSRCPTCSCRSTT